MAICQYPKLASKTGPTWPEPPMTRSRRRGRHPALTIGVALLVVAAVVFGVVATTSFSLVQAERTMGADVVTDGYGALKMDVVGCVVDGKKSRLLTATNLLGVDTTMTVSLQRGSVGTLYSNGGNGDTVTFSLLQGGTEQVDIKTETGGTFPQTFDFDLSVSGTPISISGTRTVTIAKNKCDGSGGTNTPPTADFTYDRKGKGNKIQLDGSASSDPDGSIDKYEWDFDGDGVTDATGKKVNANLPPGTDVTLTVTDNQGATDSVTKTV